MGRPNGIMLSKRSQREKRQIWYDLLYVESLGEENLIEVQRTDWWLPEVEAGVWVILVRVPTSSYKSWG